MSNKRLGSGVVRSRLACTYAVSLQPQSPQLLDEYHNKPLHLDLNTSQHIQRTRGAREPRDSQHVDHADSRAFYQSCPPAAQSVELCLPLRLRRNAKTLPNPRIPLIPCHNATMPMLDVRSSPPQTEDNLPTHRFPTRTEPVPKRLPLSHLLRFIRL